jgi:UrcA family protein
MTMFKHLGTAIAAVTLVTSFPGTATAKEKSVRVEYSDLNLANAKDRRTLDRRIDRAVARMCGSTDMARNMAEIRRVEACAAQAQASSAPQRARAEAAATRQLASAAERK